jgi:hypothetical protein
MRTLSIQFQPRRAPGLPPRRVASILAELAASVSSVRAFSLRDGNDRGPYVNYLFETRSIAKTWHAISMSVLKHRRIGARLRRSTIITCEGSRGWDNYLLLHHFNSKIELDHLPTSNNRWSET